jgi:hypothetical protein
MSLPGTSNFFFFFPLQKFQRTNFFGGCFELKVLKVKLDPQRAGDLIIPPGPQFQITKHLNLDVLAQRAKFFVGVLNLRF